MEHSNYTVLLDKLDAFIRKYYKNLLVKGLIYFLSIALVNYLLVTLLEYYGRFDSTPRAFLFFSSLLLIILVFIRYVVRPLAGLFRIGKRINHEQAGRIIGDHFVEVRDKLINTLQLKEQADRDPFNAALIQASIQQRSEELRPVPFVKAIDLRQNKQYLKYLLIPVLAMVVLLFTNARIMRDGTRRLVQYNKKFEREAPFRFIGLNERLEGVQNESVDLRVSLEGEEIPAEVFIEMDGKRYKMVKDASGAFLFTVRNLQQDFQFSFVADEFYSEEKEFDVIAKPILTAFKVRLNYPAYTGKKAETLENTGDLTIPEGTKVSWHFQTRNTNKFLFLFGNEKHEFTPSDGTAFTFEKRFLKGGSYTLALGKENTGTYDSIPYTILVTPDAYPDIQVEEKNDSLQTRIQYFVGTIGDDYGFSALRFVYRFIQTNDDTRKGKEFNMELPLNKSMTSQQFFHMWDLKELGLQPGDRLEYHFEVFDNDGIHGAKKAISQPREYEIPSEKEIKQEVEKTSENIKNKMEDAIKESKKLGKDIQRLQKKLLEKKTLSWEDKKELDALLQKQEELKNQIDELKRENMRNNQMENEFTPLQEQMMEKQQELEKLFDELFSEELQKMMEEMQRLMEEENKDLLKEELEKMELGEKELDKQLDRMLEMYKRFEVEKRVEQDIEKLEKLGDKQEKLAEETEKGETKPEEQKQKQDSLNKEFEDLKKNIEKTDSLNEELEEPLEMEMPEEEMEKIEEDMEEGSEMLEQKKKKEAAKKQKEAAKKMKEAAKKMKKEMEGMEQEQQMEDYETLRGILENLVQLSFDQEALMEELATVNSYNPKYVELVQKQKKIRDDARMVEDSLLALSKRALVLRSYINAEMGKVNDNLGKSLRYLSEREMNEARVSQQYTMTSLNNLAVMLTEILKNMQEDMMQNQGSGGGKSKKSKPKKGDAEKMRQMQEELGKQLQKMKQGEQPGGQKPGSKEWAQMAAKQEMIRRMLQDMKKQMQEEGNGKEAGELQKTIDEMEKLEKDLVNKRLNLETMKRQQEIETRMLEHERAEKEREQDPKRESKEGKQNERQMPPELEEYLRQKEKENELLKTVPPELRPYYKDKVREYFRNLNQ